MTLHQSLSTEIFDFTLLLSRPHMRAFDSEYLRTFHPEIKSFKLSTDALFSVTLTGEMILITFSLSLSE
jgi:hypothetical protein